MIHQIKNKKIAVVLDNIRSRENVGSIFRTADAAGVSKIYLCGITPKPPHEKISKTALGADTYIPWEYCKDTWRLLGKLIKEGNYVIALEKTKNADNIFKIKIKSPTALVVGNEINGLSKNILKHADITAHIPMAGRKESLNVAVATGIALYAIINE
jgi:23S rRNA (guanosine2251-2'-O)-methyltransferase